MKYTYYLCLISFIFFLNTNLSAQQKSEDLENLYEDFLKSRLNQDYNSAITLGERILPQKSNFSEKRQLAFAYTLAKMYEDNHLIEKAIPLYQEVLTKEPNYYVPHRALGFYYLNKSNELVPQLKAANNSTEQRKQQMEKYSALLLQALPHLEKAYACDPDDETLRIIRNLMTTVGPKAKAQEFESRITQMKEKCASILTE